jgi:hypothetical protein
MRRLTANFGQSSSSILAELRLELHNLGTSCWGLPLLQNSSRCRQWQCKCSETHNECGFCRFCSWNTIWSTMRQICYGKELKYIMMIFFALLTGVFSRFHPINCIRAQVTPMLPWYRLCPSTVSRVVESD